MLDPCDRQWFKNNTELIPYNTLLIRQTLLLPSIWYFLSIAMYDICRIMIYYCLKMTKKTGKNRPVSKVRPDRTGNRQTGRSGNGLPVFAGPVPSMDYVLSATIVNHTHICAIRSDSCCLSRNNDQLTIASTSSIKDYNQVL